ncbi:MAG: hypothetical protein H3C37_00990 [Candidatus Kapabacteria bacterium]|nr:hypothetical protein [Candidatus Kapabacteria bacterium]
MAKILLIFLMPAYVLALTNDELGRMVFFDDETYVIRLVNGDMLSGTISMIDSDASGTFVKISSLIGQAKVYAKEIDVINSTEKHYRHRHRGYIMPTAIPVSGDHFVSLMEGIFPYAGAGIGQVVSITAGRSLIPGLPLSDQASAINAKFTLAKSVNGLIEDGWQFYALGANVGWLNDVNFMAHIYGVATWTGKRTQASTMLFGKVAGEDTYTIHAGTLTDPFGLVYATGSIGAALSLDTRFPEFHDLHFVGELWASDLSKPSNTMLYMGLRQANTAVAMDFGLALVPGPMVFPLVGFAWTPW